MGHRILIVDDEQEIRQFLGLVLRDRGYEVVTASGGEEGLARARADRPHLVLLDIMMPDIDGWTVLRTLKADQELADIPVAMVTARTEARDRARALKEGATDYIAKPFSLHDLLRRVAGILQPPDGLERPVASKDA